MSQRNPLRNQLRQAWESTISDAYDKRLINSERGLQVYFCTALRDQFNASGARRHLFVEPATSFGSFKRHPDLLICNSRNKIIGVVELKYTPRAKPKTGKDMETLRLINSTAGEVTVSNARYKGPTKSKAFIVAGDAVYCWAAVYSADARLKLPESPITELGKKFLRLDALSRENEKAIIKHD